MYDAQPRKERGGAVMGILLTGLYVLMAGVVIGAVARAVSQWLEIRSEGPAYCTDIEEAISQ